MSVDVSLSVFILASCLRALIHPVSAGKTDESELRGLGLRANNETIGLARLAKR